MTLNSFSLNLPLYEKNLSIENPTQLVKHFQTDNFITIEKLENIISPIQNFSPCSMLLENQNDLFYHLQKLHTISSAHYKLGITHNMKGKFPHSCCGISSDNLNFSLLQLGYENSMKVSSDKEFDHEYNLLPFTLKKENKKGVIIIDPTSDQLWHKLHPKQRPKNMITVHFSNIWEYKTNWHNGANLSPDGITNKRTIKDTLTWNKNKSKNTKISFQNFHEGLAQIEIFKSLKNPIKLNI